METPILFHGGPAVFEAPDPVRSGERVRLGALWFTPEPFVAALYAGHDGWVQRAALEPGARVLDASGGHGSGPLHPLAMDEVERVEALRERLGIPVARDGLLLGAASRHVDTEGQGLGDHPCWEGILLDEDIPTRLLGDLVRGMGWDAVICTDPAEGIGHDVHDRMVERLAREVFSGLELRPNEKEAALWEVLGERRRATEGYRLLNRASRMLERTNDRVPVVAVLDPAAVRMRRGPILGEAVLRGHLQRRPRVLPTDIGALRASCRTDDVAAMPRAVPVAGMGQGRAGHPI